MMRALFRETKVFLEMIKFAHVIFALPFALTSVVLAAHQEGWPSFAVWGFVLLAVLGLRTAAMGVNRLADRNLDAQNPRTQNRALITGAMKPLTAVLWVVVSAGVFLYAAYRLGPWCLALSPVALIFALGYSFTKRFTTLCHFILGMTLGMAPVGAWMAVTGMHFGAAALVLLGVVTLWVAGFDMIYACQDVDVDKRDGLFSIPSRYGVGFALTLSAWCHVLMMAGLLILPLFAQGLSWVYGVGVALVGAVLWYEHTLVKPHDLSRVDMAFFALNGAVSLLWAAFTMIDVVFMA